MKVQIYSIYDKKSGVYMRPTFIQNDQVAVRSMTAALPQQQDLMDYPEDYSLNNIGVFDDSTGEIENKPNTIVAEIATLKAECLQRAKVQQPNPLPTTSDNEL